LHICEFTKVDGRASLAMWALQTFGAGRKRLALFFRLSPEAATKAAPPAQEIAWLATVIGAISAAGVGVAVVFAAA
jgi:hypothetical protein